MSASRREGPKTKRTQRERGRMERSRDAARTETASGAAARCYGGREGGTHAVACTRECPQTRFTPDEEDETREAGAGTRWDRARTGRAASDLQAGAVRGRIMAGRGRKQKMVGGGGPVDFVRLSRSPFTVTAPPPGTTSDDRRRQHTLVHLLRPLLGPSTTCRRHCNALGVGWFRECTGRTQEIQGSTSGEMTSSMYGLLWAEAGDWKMQLRRRRSDRSRFVSDGVGVDAGMLEEPVG